MTLTEFLLARIAEDEAAATMGEGWNADARADDVPVQFWDYGETHIGYRRFLAECEAKRRIVEECRTSEILSDEGTNGFVLARSTLSLLALPYADHEDYDEAWRP